MYSTLSNAEITNIKDFINRSSDSVSGALTLSATETQYTKYVYSDFNIKLANLRNFTPEDFYTFPLSGYRIDANTVINNNVVQPSAFDIVTDLEAIRGSIHNILYTKAGERVMEPDFGINLEDFLFELVTPDMLASLRASVNRAFKKWDERLTCKSVRQIFDKAQNLLEISIDVEIAGFPTILSVNYRG